MGEQIPLYGSHAEWNDGSISKGLVMKSSDCPEGIPPTEARKKHRKLQENIDQRKVPNGEQVGWIEMDGCEVVDYQIDKELL